MHVDGRGTAAARPPRDPLAPVAGEAAMLLPLPRTAAPRAPAALLSGVAQMISVVSLVAITGTAAAARHHPVAAAALGGVAATAAALEAPLTRRGGTVLPQRARGIAIGGVAAAHGGSGHRLGTRQRLVSGGTARGTTAVAAAVVLASAPHPASGPHRLTGSQQHQPMMQHVHRRLQTAWTASLRYEQHVEVGQGLTCLLTVRRKPL